MMGSSHKSLIKVLLLFVFVVAWGCESGGLPEGAPVKLPLALSRVPYSGLIAIADEKGYFKEAGLDVSLDFHPSGRECLDAVCHGEAQVATVADIAFSAKALD